MLLAPVEAGIQRRMYQLWSGVLRGVVGVSGRRGGGGLGGGAAGAQGFDLGLVVVGG